MEAAVAIEQDASRLADLRHSEVLRDGFRLSGITCHNCNYPGNAWEFSKILKTHTELHVELHRSTRPIWRPDGTYVSRGCRTYIASNGEIRYRWELEFWISESRQKLKKFWPCESCILRYNPTLRLKHGPPQWPEQREDVFSV